jgi:hypothetical protein
MPDMAFDFSSIPDAKPTMPTQIISPYDEMNQPQSSEMDTAVAATNQRMPIYISPEAPANLLRENAPQLQRDVWNMASAPLIAGPMIEHPLRPNTSYATGVLQN